jgi:hypothetical protein
MPDDVPDIASMNPEAITPEFIAMVRGIAARWDVLADAGPEFAHLREAATHLTMAVDAFEFGSSRP